MLPTSYRSASHTGVNKGNTVAVWSLGPIGFTACAWAFHRGAKPVFRIDSNWRTEFAKQRIKDLETINYKALGEQSVPARLHGLVSSNVDVCIEASSGEYAKSRKHEAQLASGIEQDTSEILKECIYSTGNFGKASTISDYVDCKYSTDSLASIVADSDTVTNHLNVGALVERGTTVVRHGQTPVQKYKLFQQ